MKVRRNMAGPEELFVPEEKKLYVGCGLTDAPEEFVAKVETLKEALDKDWQVLRFLGLTAGTAADVYRHDIGCVRNCDAFLAVLDESSTGLGMEITTALAWGKPVLGVAHIGYRLSRMIVGAADDHPHFTLERYEDMVRDVPEITTQQLLPQVRETA
jgi:nucleoside 2-deoxyribosyltransferase